MALWRPNRTAWPRSNASGRSLSWEFEDRLASISRLSPVTFSGVPNHQIVTDEHGQRPVTRGEQTAEPFSEAAGGSIECDHDTTCIQCRTITSCWHLNDEQLERDCRGSPSVPDYFTPKFAESDAGSLVAVNSRL